MGMVLGKISVEEPAFKVLFNRAPTAPASNVSNTITTPYEIRKYGKRYAIESIYDSTNADRSPFMALAGYIGVTKAPENESNESIAMTAPVAIDRKERDNKRMKFILPSKYDDISKIPKPKNSDKVSIREVAPAVGAVHQFSGAFDDSHCEEKARALAAQLIGDGISLPTGKDGEVELGKINYEWWGYNPPFTIPMLRRNEIWIELTEEQVNELIGTKGEEASEWEIMNSLTKFFVHDAYQI